MLLREVISEYLTVGCKHFSDDTRNERNYVLGRLSAELGDKPITECKPFHLLAWLEKQTTWKAQTTRGGRTFRILSAFNWAVRMGLIERNPFMEGHGNPYETFIGGIDSDCGFPGLGDDDFAKLLSCCTTIRLKRAMLFMRHTGCRPVELRRLTWGQIDWDKRIAVQTEHKTSKKSGGRPRVIHLTDDVIGILEAVRREQLTIDPDRHVFVNERSNKWGRQSLCGSIRRVSLAAGLDTSAYGFGRVAFIERGILANVNLKTIAELVGHANTQMADRVYSRRLGQYGAHLRDAAASIASAPLLKKVV